jgi:hypothetical protein
MKQKGFIDIMLPVLLAVIICLGIVFFMNSAGDALDESFAKRKAIEDAARPIADKFIEENCPKTRVGGARNETVYICNNGDNEYTYYQLLSKFSEKQ